MTHTYEVTGMTCAGCAEHVRKALLRHPDVVNAEVSLPDEAVVTINKHIPEEALQELVGASGHYGIREGKVE